MKVTLIEFGKENANGRIYLHQQVSELPKQVLCALDYSKDKHGNSTFDIPLSEACGFANTSMDSNGIYAEIKPFLDEKGKKFEEMMIDGFSIAPCGTGHLNENKEVQDFRLHYVFLTKNPA